MPRQGYNPQAQAAKQRERQQKRRDSRQKALERESAMAHSASGTYDNLLLLHVC